MAEQNRIALAREFYMTHDDDTRGLWDWMADYADHRTAEFAEMVRELELEATRHDCDEFCSRCLHLRKQALGGTQHGD